MSKREEEVLQLIADGCSSAEVAERLFISKGPFGLSSGCRGAPMILVTTEAPPGPSPQGVPSDDPVPHPRQLPPGPLQHRRA
ncbi:MAG: LuxR C-terminal-related transcriptional regulator, partial [Actinobacteria bacterium]|nr:LuxR C-terminal-related transcriptional regulator [Actinomycetota bacterium]